MWLTPVSSLILAVLAGVSLLDLMGPTSIPGGPVAWGEGAPVVFTTTPQRVRFRVDTRPETFQSLATLTLVEALSDDSLRALVVVTIGESERTRLEKQFAPRSSIPATLEHREVRLKWRPRTSCPDLEIDLPALTFDAAGLPLTTIPSRLKIDVPLISTDSIPQLLCSWTRQINARRPREGVIMAINRLLLPR